VSKWGIYRCPGNVSQGSRLIRNQHNEGLIAPVVLQSHFHDQLGI
jgi:hypothetical protein